MSSSQAGKFIFEGNMHKRGKHLAPAERSRKVELANHERDGVTADEVNIAVRRSKQSPGQQGAMLKVEIHERAWNQYIQREKKKKTREMTRVTAA